MRSLILGIKMNGVRKTAFLTAARSSPMISYVLPSAKTEAVITGYMDCTRVYTLVHMLSPAFLSEVELLRDWLTAIGFDSEMAFRERKRNAPHLTY